MILFNKTIELILLFLYVFGVSFSGTPVNSTKLSFILFFLYFLFSNIHNKDGARFDNQLLLYLLYFTLLLVFSVLYPVVHETYDFSMAYSYVMIIIESLIGGWLVHYALFRKYKLKKILDYIIAICFIQALIILLMYVDSNFREFIFSITNSTSESLFNRYKGFRGLGLASSVTYDLSVTLSVGMMFISYIICTDFRKRKLYYVIAWLVTLLAILMTGRSGLLGVIFSLIIPVFFFGSKLALKNIAFFIFISGILLLLGMLILDSEIYKFIDLIIPYAFEFIINFNDSGSFDTVSTDNIARMYFNINEDTLLYGDGYWKKDGGYYMGIDAGYMRQVLFYGIFPSLFLYSLYVYGFYLMYKNSCNLKKFSYVIFFILIYFFIIQIKGAFMTGSGMNIRIFFLLLIYFIHSNYTKNYVN
jgi:hypothetical protein